MHYSSLYILKTQRKALLTSINRSLLAVSMIFYYYYENLLVWLEVGTAVMAGSLFHIFRFELFLKRFCCNSTPRELLEFFSSFGGYD